MLKKLQLLIAVEAGTGDDAGKWIVTVTVVGATLENNKVTISVTTTFGS